MAVNDSERGYLLFRCPVSRNKDVKWNHVFALPPAFDRSRHMVWNVGRRCSSMRLSVGFSLHIIGLLFYFPSLIFPSCLGDGDQRHPSLSICHGKHN